MINAVMDPHFDSYESFLDSQWADEIDEAAKGSAISEIVLNLIFAWRLSSNTFRLPWLMVQQLKHFGEGLVNGPIGHQNELVTKIVNLLSERLPTYMDANLRREQRRQLRTGIALVAEEVKKANEAVKIPIDAHAYWSDIITLPVVQLSILGSQRLSFVALYFGYEDFVHSIYRAKTGDTRERLPPSKEFGKLLAKETSGDVRDYCWSDTRIVVAGLVRNALAHNGGRFTKDLEPYRNDFFSEPLPDGSVSLQGDKYPIMDNTITIVAPNTRYLFNLLKDPMEEKPPMDEKPTSASKMNAYSNVSASSVPAASWRAARSLAPSSHE